MKKFWTLILVLLSFVLPLSTFAQEALTVSLDTVKSTKSQNIETGMYHNVRVSYIITASTAADVEITELEFAMLGTSGAVSAIEILCNGNQVGTSSVTVVGNIAHAYNLNCVIPKGTYSNFEIFPMYLEVGTGGIPSGSTSQISLTSVKYVSNGTVTKVKVATDPSPLMTLVPSTFPKVTLTADNQNVTYGGSTYIRWNSTNTTTCTGINFNTNGLTSGVYYTGPMTKTTTFSIITTNNNGKGAGTSVTVVVVPQVSIHHRIIGAGTRVTLPFYISGSATLEGFQLTVEKDSRFDPSYFQIGPSFSNWSYVSDVTDSHLKVAAVGNPIQKNDGEEVFRITMNITKGISGGFYPALSFFDGKNYWGANGYVTVMDLPIERYGDLDNDGIDINDAIILNRALGTNITDETFILIYDADGDGFLTSSDLQSLLSTIATGRKDWPIFYNTSITVPVGNIKTPVIVTWQKMTDGKWGAFSKEVITNGDLIGKNISNLSSPNSGMSKKVNGKFYFAGRQTSISSPIVINDIPVELTGTLNNGRPISATVSSTTDVAEDKMVPKEFSLAQNYPNPFNPSTMISYTLPSAGFVNLTVYNILGKEVATLVNETKNEGSYSVKFDASNLPSGTYVYRISAGKIVETKKMVLMK